MKRLLLFSSLLLLAVPCAYGEIYTWKDARGTVHYTNSIHEIPARYLRRAKVLDIATGKTTGPATAAPAQGVPQGSAPAGGASAGSAPAPIQSTPMTSVTTPAAPASQSSYVPSSQSGPVSAPSGGNGAGAPPPMPPSAGTAGEQPQLKEKPFRRRNFSRTNDE